MTLANRRPASNASVTWATADAHRDGAGRAPLTSSASITIPSVGAASPYPLNFAVSGLPTSVSHLKVRLNSLSHTLPADIDALLVGPGGQKVMLMSGDWNGGAGQSCEPDLRGRRAAASADRPVVTGTYSPTNYFPGFDSSRAGTGRPVRHGVVGVQRHQPERHLELYVARQ